MELTRTLVLPAFITVLFLYLEINAAAAQPVFQFCNQACNPPPHMRISQAEMNVDCGKCCSYQMRAQFVNGRCARPQSSRYGNRGLICYCESGYKVPTSGNICLAEQNRARGQYRVPALTYNTRLSIAAKAHNDAMVRTGVVEHQCPREPRLDSRVIQVGYPFSVVAENIAAGPPTCSDVVKSWLNSKGHRENLLGRFTHVGCAVVMPQSGKYKTLWTCVYANPRR